MKLLKIIDVKFIVEIKFENSILTILYCVTSAKSGLVYYSCWIRHIIFRGVARLLTAYRRIVIFRDYGKSQFAFFPS